MKKFLIRTYGRTELARLYCPNVGGHSAWQTLRRWIEHHPTLPSQLKTLGYTGKDRVFTPRQVMAIVEALGEP